MGRRHARQRRKERTGRGGGVGLCLRLHFHLLRHTCNHPRRCGGQRLGPRRRRPPLVHRLRQWRGREWCAKSVPGPSRWVRCTEEGPAQAARPHRFSRGGVRLAAAGRTRRRETRGGYARRAEPRPLRPLAARCLRGVPTHQRGPAVGPPRAAVPPAGDRPRARPACPPRGRAPCRASPPPRPSAFRCLCASTGGGS